MKDWLTPQEIAALKLRGMPTHEVSIRRMCQKNLLVSRSKERGKGIEISVSSLPIEAQRDYFRRVAVVEGQDAESQLVSSPIGEEVVVGLLEQRALDDEREAKRVARARQIMAALRPLLALPERAKGRRAMAELIAQDLGMSWQQVYRLADLVQKGGMLSLVRQGRRRDRGGQRVVISERWEAWCVAVQALWPRAGDIPALSERLRQKIRQAWVAGAPSERQCWLKATTALAQELEGEGCPADAITDLLKLPCPRRFVAAEAQHFRVTGRALRDGKAVYDRHLTPVRRTAIQYQPGDLVCGDITPLDIPCRREDGSMMYARIIAWHDIATNWLWVDLVPLEKGEGIRREHVAASFARMCEEAPFGAPKRLYLDHGSEYKWEDMLDAWSRLAELTAWQTRIDIASLLPEAGRVTRSIPFHPRGKRVEGLFGNLAHWLGWWFGYVGGNRLTKKVANLGKAPQPSDFAAVESWLKATIADYHVTPQQAEHMGGMSPQQRLEAFLAQGWRPYRIDRRALMLAFAERDWRRIHRGAVQWDGRFYTCDAFMAMEGRVLCARPKLADLDCLIVFDATGRYVDIALPEQVYALQDPAGAKEAARRKSVLKILQRERLAEAGGVLDEAGLAGYRARVLGLAETEQRAREGAITLELSDTHRSMIARLGELSDGIQALMRRVEAAKQAEELHRLAFEDEETKAARALGF